MWDVIWTDPDKELVGEHRARKGRLRDDKEKSSIRSGRDSAATSPSNSSSEAPFTFFRSKSAKNANALKEKDSNRSPSFSGLATPSLTSTLSPFSQTFDSSSRRSSGMVTTAPTSPSKDGPETLFSGSERDTFPSFDGQQYALIDQKNTDKFDKECLSQSFGSIDSAAANPISSFSDANGAEPPNIATLIQMLGDLPPKLDLQDIPRSISRETDRQLKNKSTDKETPSSSVNLLVTPPKSPTKYHGPYLISENLPESPIMLTPPPKSPRRPTQTLLAMNNPAAWRTPSQWRDQDAKGLQRATRAASRKTDKENDIKTEAFAIRESIECVRSAAGAPTAMILAKVKQVVATNPRVRADVEPENSKQHWMLSLLHGLGYVTDPELDERNVVTLPPTAHAMLLYETEEYAMYLNTVYPKTQLYHITKEVPASGLSHNIQPIHAPLDDAECFPVPPRVFQTVFSYSLPSRCSYDVLPNILGSVNKCLKPGGSFKVTIIDPLPCAETLGHKLRDWMEKHLFPNIEQKSRCLEPSRLFPKLLGEAGLRGKGSRRTKVKFFALQENARGADHHDPDVSIQKLYRERQDKAELRSLVGRMFWLEVWGQYVTPPNSWWWDDAECVAECRQLGTFWEYHIIDAVKFEQNMSETIF